MPIDSSDSDEQAIFNAATQFSDSRQVAAFLDIACKGKPELRSAIEARMGAARPTVDVSAQLGGGMSEAPTGDDERSTIVGAPGAGAEEPGRMIGRYKLLQQIGMGGCGVVYMASQDEPVRRRVALKVIKLGMDTKQVIARFDAERQALALMDHPHIAKVLDAGSTETGRPYFVMELVKGIPITRYCDENHLNMPARLALFTQVCQAIQHAHQKGIIHRDIKPSNVLVADHDGSPVPKIIDFGIAKATTDQRLTDMTLFTALEQFVGTPTYMSPEQAKLSGLDVDTRSDIYSLGVLLYELLTGKTPFDSDAWRAKGLDEIRRIIREAEPPRPSTRLTMLDAKEQTTLAHSRHSEARKLAESIRGDLDWIVMKCLEKDRTRRYETANGLAMDIKRYLDDEPVVARPPHPLYRLRKAFRRHQVAFVAGGAIVATLILGVIGTTLGLLRAEKLRRNAERLEQAQIELRDKAVKERTRAEAQELAARRAAYSSDMNLVQQALAQNNLGRARRFLDRERPQAGQADLRGWEWRYLWSQTRADESETFYAGTNRFLHPLSFSPDGALLAREELGRTVVCEVLSRRAIFQRTNAVRPVFLHRDARLAFVDTSVLKQAVVLLSIGTQNERRIETSSGDVRWIDFTPDDLRLLTVAGASGDDAITSGLCDLTAWDVDTGRQIWKQEIPLPSTRNGRPYVISPDGGAVAAALPDGRVQVFDCLDGRSRYTIRVTDDLSISLAFSPDSLTLLTGAGYIDSAIHLWDARNGSAGASVEAHRSWVSDLIFTPDGKRLVSSSGDQTIRLWDWPSLKPAGVLRGHSDEVDGLAVSANGRTLASRGKDGTIFLWDVTKPSRHLGYRTLPRLTDSAGTMFTPDSRSILAAEPGGAVAVWDASKLSEMRRYSLGPTNSGSTIVSPDANWIARGDARGRLALWDSRVGVESTNFAVAPGPFVACFTSDGRFVVTLHRTEAKVDSVVQLWETGTWRRVASRSIPSEGTHQLYSTKRSNLLVIAGDQAVQLFDPTKLESGPRQIDGPGDPFDVASSPDGRMLAAAYEDGSVRVWDVDSLKLLASLKEFALSANAVAFSSDGRRMAAGSHGMEAVKLWDPETWQEVLTLGGEGSGFATLKFSGDGRFLLAINGVGLAHLWTAPSWAEIDAAESEDRRLAGR